MTNPNQPELPAPIAALIDQVYRVEGLIDDASRQYHDSTRWSEEPSVYDDRSSPTLQDVIDGGFNNLRDMLREYAATHAASRPADGVPASVKQKWPARQGYPKPDENGNETGDIGELAYADGWNACLDEAKRLSGVPMPLKGKKGVVVEEDASAPTSAQSSVSDGQCQQLVLDGQNGSRRCLFKPAHGDTLCKRHRVSAEATGYEPSRTIDPTPDAAARARGDVFDEAMELAEMAQRIVMARPVYKSTTKKRVFDFEDARSIARTLEGRLIELANKNRPLTTPSDAGGDREDEDYHVIMTMGRLLAEIAVILKGTEPAGSAWSYHDLPELVKSAVENAHDIASEMRAWAAVKMRERGSSRRDKMMVEEWSKRLLALPEVTFPVKDFDIPGLSITKEEIRFAIRKVVEDRVFIGQDFGDTPPNPGDARLRADVDWRPPSELPPTKLRTDQDVLVAVRRSHSPGKVWTYPATYANGYPLCSGRDPDTFTSSGNHWHQIPADDDNDTADIYVTGFYDVKSTPDGEWDFEYEPALHPEDELVAWATIPQYDELLSILDGKGVSHG